jgi:microcystin-dependent protein
MSSPFLGEIRAFGFGFPPKGWALCNGQIMSIAQNTALFSLLGTYYGGNGVNTFALPNLQSQVPLGYGTSIAGNTYVIGEFGGVENVALTQSTMPTHNHNLLGINAAGADHFPGAGAYSNASSTNAYYATDAVPVSLNPATVLTAGSGLPHSNIQPYLTISWCIALTGIFPSRN